MKKITYKTLAYSFITSLTLGLSSCYFDDSYNQDPQYYPEQGPMASQSMQTDQTMAEDKKYTSKNPTQKQTPGPKHGAAPQLPVIQ